MDTNWVHDDTMQSHRKEAIDNLKRIKQDRKGVKFVLVPHPTIKNTFIEKKQ